MNKLIVLLSLCFLLFSCSEEEKYNFKVGDCFNMGRWKNYETQEESKDLIQNSVLQIFSKYDNDSYSVGVYSKKDNVFLRGGFSLPGKNLKNNGKIVCPLELEDQSMLNNHKMSN